MVLTLGLSCLLIYLSLGYVSRVFAFVFCSCFMFSPLLRSHIGGGFLVCYFSSFSFFYLFFGCSNGKEREACVCDHGLERSDLCAEIIIIIMIIIVYKVLCWCSLRAELLQQCFFFSSRATHVSTYPRRVVNSTLYGLNTLLTSLNLTKKKYPVIAGYWFCHVNDTLTGNSFNRRMIH